MTRHPPSPSDDRHHPAPPSTDVDDELQGWIDDWGASTEVPSHEERDHLKRRARRFGAGLLWLTGVEIVFCLGALIWVTTLAWQRGTSEFFTLALMIWPLVIGGQAWLLWNRRGTWRPRNDSVRAFLELEQLRVERQLFTATRLMPAFYAVELAILIPWKWWQLSLHQPDTVETRMLRLAGILAGITLALVGGMLGWRRRMLERREDLAQLAATLEIEGDDSDEGDHSGPIEDPPGR